MQATLNGTPNLQRLGEDAISQKENHYAKPKPVFS
jgi:hypothetical protein